ncbi:MAG: prephenate dehydratase [Anaerolineae bacterium]|nr:prephenate dehydratase [Anaerolineae bacterium]
MTRRVAFQGIHGAYSEQAIRQHFGDDVETVPCRTFIELFQCIESQQADHAILPIENAQAGTVSQSYELLMEHDLRVQGEVILHVRHALLAPLGTRLTDLQRVRSHPQALAQCEQYLRRFGLEAEPWYDTAGSARDLAAAPIPGVGAIASPLAAELYGLEVIEPNIEDVAHNFTRFFILGIEDAERAEKNKTSLVFATRHRPAALYECLGEFALRGINLTKIESRPRRNRPWEYVFYLDFEGHWKDPVCEAALVALLRRASFVKMLGSYPAADSPIVETA